VPSRIEKNFVFSLYNVLLRSICVNDIVKYTLSVGGFYSRGYKKATTKSENKQSEFQYSAICQAVIWWHITRETAWTNIPQLFFSLKLLWKSDFYLTFITHSNFQKLRPYFFPCQQFHNLLQLVLELRTLHTVGTNKLALIRSLLSLSQLIIWKLRLWKSDNYKWSSKLHGNIIPNIKINQ